jgi:hypothetical protein
VEPRKRPPKSLCPQDLGYRERLTRQWEARARRIVEAIRALPPEALAPPPGNWQRSRVGVPPITAAVRRAAQAPAPVICDAWRYIHLIERYPGLAPPHGTRGQVIRIARVWYQLPEAERDARLPALAQASPRQLQAEYRGLRQQARQAKATAAQAKRPARPQGTKPRPPRRPSKITGALWYERIVEVRRHLLVLKHEGLVENLAATWTPQNLEGYLNELEHVIRELRDLQQRLQGVKRERTALRLLGRQEDPR